MQSLCNRDSAWTIEEVVSKVCVDRAKLFPP